MLVQGGGGQHRRHFGGSWYGGWRWMDSLGACPSLRAQPSMLTPASVTLPLTGGVQQECGTVLRKASTTTTPNHPHTLIRYMSGKAQGWSEQSRRLGNRRITQPIGGRTYGGWRRAADARSASIQGGNTPQRFGRSITPTGPGRPLRPGWKIGSRIGGAPQGAQPYLGGWGRQGWDKGQDESMWSVKGGCTLSRPKLGRIRMTQQ